MYCQKCNKLLDDNNLICPHCGYDNQENSKNKLKESDLIKKKRPYAFILLIFLLCALAITLLVILIIHENKNKDTNYYDETTTYITSESFNNEFTYKNISLKYPDNWGSSTGTVFYKDYAKINITFRTITENDYKELLDVNECLDYSFNTFKAKTYASDNAYAYIFEFSDTYYLITVNYTNDSSIFTAKVQNEISEIISTISVK